MKTSPEVAYKNSKAALRFVSADQVASAFMHSEARRVDKSGCVSFCGKKYEVGVLFAGQTVNIVFDPADTTKALFVCLNFFRQTKTPTEIVIVEHERSGSAFQVKELKIGVHTGPRPKLPKFMTKAIPETSCLLDEKEKRYNARQEVVRRAISFKDLSGENGGEADV